MVLYLLYIQNSLSFTQQGFIKRDNKDFYNVKATLCDFYPHLVVKRYMTIQ